ncbi:zinc finger protein 14 [Nothobranchius furzeri]|uniref:Si:dkey-78k22.1 n=1 Tax=Nothobranchius furzeri TaxID=105023 RepID=A0A1A7ZVI0_NOTFU|nr:zinc finger protein 93 [Nothobranchius furzeri]KAF7210818.1 zinc finger protein 93-like [Nothobranchius furzeri]
MDVSIRMSLIETPPRCDLRALAESVSELLTRVGEEVLGELEKLDRGSRKSSGASARLFQPLRQLLTERIATVGQRIMGLLEQEVEEYRRRLEWQSRLLEAVLSPVVRLNRTDSVNASALKTTTVPSPVLSDFTHLPSDSPDSSSSDVTAGESDEDWGESETSENEEAEITEDIDQASLVKPENHLCVICKKSFRHKENLVKHMETHSDPQDYLCGVCGQRLESSEGLSNHLRSHREAVNKSGTCEICGKTFQNMETHIRSHTGVKPFSCDFCGKRFPRSGALRRHKKIHSRKEPDTCHICGMTFDKIQLLKKHLKTHKGSYEDQSKGGDVKEDDEVLDQKVNTGSAIAEKSVSFRCEACGDSFYSRGFLRKHAATHCNDSKSICGVCGERLDSPGSLLTHLQSHKETGGTCSLCGKSFRNMKMHMRRHTGFKPYRCTVCSKRFPRPGSLRRHKKIHSGGCPHTCRQCGKAFNERSALKAHVRSHLTEIRETSDVESQEDVQNLNPETLNTKSCVSLSCKVCGETFQTKGSLRKHARAHAAESTCGVCGETLLPSETLTDHLQTHRELGKICHICGKTYQNIQTHMRSHTGIKPYHCSVCGKSFPRPGALRRHKRIHNGERPYICEFCGKMYTDNSSLTTHIRNHTGKKPANRVSCEICGKSLASAQILEVHKRIHTGEKSFLCRICGKAFRQLGGLNAHMLTHTGQKPFSCNLCSKSFSTKGYLETHIRFHKKERPFGCHLCWKAFVTKSDLKKHLLTHTGDKPYSCTVCGKSYQEKRSRDVHMKVHQEVQSNREPIRRQESRQPDFIQL